MDDTRYNALRTKEDEEGASIAPTSFPRGELTRALCLIGLSVTAIVSFVCLAIGAAHYDAAQIATQGWLKFHMRRAFKEVIPLLLNVVVTILTETTGLIHATSLRWALGDRLTFASNLRLFSRGNGQLPFGRVSNFLNAGFLVLSYSAPSLIVVGIPPSPVCDQSSLNVMTCDDNSATSTVYFCPGALIALGVGLAGTSILTTWQLCAVKIPTWSTTPIDIAWASSVTGRRQKVHGRCMMSVHDSEIASMPTRPRPQQRSPWTAHREIRRVLIYLWVLVVAALIWFGALAGGIASGVRKCPDDGSYVCTVYLGNSWSLLPDLAGVTSLAQIDTVDNENQSALNHAGFAGAFLLILAFQAMLTMGLHCSELLVNVSRDEDVWRQAATSRGYKSRNALLTILRSWKCLLLLALKPLVHWLFGLGMTFYFGWGIFMRPPQLLYMSLALIVLAVFGTALCFARPSGPQPAAFGHVQTLIDLVDDWSEHLFWGQKGQAHMGISHAGTSAAKLEPVSMTEDYADG